MKQRFRTWVDQHQQRVYSHAFYILADANEAEDATQEAFVRLWAKMNQSAVNELDSESAKAWLLHVTRNLCIDKLRRRKPLADLEIDTIQSDSKEGKPAAQLMSKQVSDWLSTAIQRLKEPYRSLIILADLQQYSLKEAAQSLELNENQAKVYIHRGRKQLRGLLQGIEL